MTPSLASEQTAEGWRSHLQYCDFGYTPTHRIDLDLVRLGALCGASNGLTRGPRTVKEVQVSEPLRIPLAELSRGCGRVVVAVQGTNEATADRQTLSSHQLLVRVESGGRVVASCDLWHSSWCPAAEVICDLPDAFLTLDTGIREEPAKVGVEVWHRPNQ